MATYVPVEEQAEVDKYWMREALAMAEEAFRAAEVPVGCVFVEQPGLPGCPLYEETGGRGRCIARARNRTNELRNATLHAELEAITSILAENSLDILQRTSLYVTVEPCVMCASALRQVNIGQVYYGAGNDRFGGCGSVVPINADPNLTSHRSYCALGGYYRDEAIMLLRRFYMTENQNAPVPKKKATRVLKTEIPPVPGSRPSTPAVSFTPQLTD